jgi:hypothetical protein
MGGGARVFKLLTLESLANLPKPTWLVDGIILANAFAVLYGAPGCGKTFVALSWALSIATGHPWCGKITEQGSVLYVAAEGLRGLDSRVQAYQLKHGIKAERVRYLGDSFNLRNGQDVECLGEAMAGTLMPNLIVLDPRSGVGGRPTVQSPTPRTRS